jgi:hypothetical protein
MNETETAPSVSDVHPPYKARELADVITLRRQIMEAFEALAGDSNRISADMVAKWIGMKHGVTPSLHQLGNNFRILKNQGMIECSRSRGYSWWFRTARKYREEYPVKMLLPVPQALYFRVTELARAAKISRVKFMRNLIALGLQSLDPLRKAENYVDYLEEWQNSKAVRDAVAMAEAPLRAHEPTFVQPPAPRLPVDPAPTPALPVKAPPTAAVPADPPVPEEKPVE